jgi:hypothetical protein
MLFCVKRSARTAKSCTTHHDSRHVVCRSGVRMACGVLAVLISSSASLVDASTQGRADPTNPEKAGVPWHALWLEQPTFSLVSPSFCMAGIVLKICSTAWIISKTSNECSIVLVMCLPSVRYTAPTTTWSYSPRATTASLCTHTDMHTRCVLSPLAKLLARTSHAVLSLDREKAMASCASRSDTRAQGSWPCTAILTETGLLAMS